MAERTWRPTEVELESSLRDLGARVAYPATPDVASAVPSAVRSRLATARRPFWAVLRPVARPLAFAALALALLAAGILAVFPEARDAVAERLGLRGVTIEHLPFVPSATPTPSPIPTPTPAATPLPSPTPAPAGARLGLGTAVTLAEAQARVPYGALVPSAPELATPDEVYVSQTWSGEQVALVYRARPGVPEAGETGVGLLLIQFRGQVDAALFGKGLGPGTRLEQVTVNGSPGFWIEGRPHAVFYRDATGQVRDDTIRLAGNVLLWEQGSLTLRLESALSKDEALRIAQSVR